MWHFLATANVCMRCHSRHYKGCSLEAGKGDFHNTYNGNPQCESRGQAYILRFVLTN